MASQSMSPFGGLFLVLGLALFGLGIGVGLSATKEQQMIAAGALIGSGVAGGLCVLAAANTLPPREGRPG